MSDIHYIARRAYRVFLYTLALLVITAAVLLSVARILLPEVKGYREHLEQELGTYLEQKVSIKSMDARLVGLTPTLIFNDVHLKDRKSGREIISFREARLGIAVLASITARTLVPSSFTIVETRISVTRTVEGRFIVQGVDLPGLDTQQENNDVPANAELADWLFNRSNIKLADSTIIWKQQGKGGKVWRFEHVNIALHNSDERHQLTGNIILPASLGESMQIALDVTGDLRNPAEWVGVYYFKGKAVKFDKIGVLPPIHDVKFITGIADYEIWGKWEKGRIIDVSGDVAMFGMTLQKPDSGKKIQVDRVRSLFAWSSSDDGWKLNLTDLEYVLRGVKRPFTQLNLDWQEGANDKSSSLDVSLGYGRAEDLREFIRFARGADDETVKLLNHLKPEGAITSFRAFMQLKNSVLENYQISAKLDKLNITAWENYPGFFGLSGKIVFSEQQGLLRLHSPFFTLHAPKIFRNELYVDQAAGVVRWKKIHKSWQINAEKIAISNNDLNLTADVSLTTSGNRAPHHLDVQAALTDVNATSFTRYLPTELLGKNLVKWLDQAFIGGNIQQIAFVYKGNMQKLPFRHGKGVLQAYLEAEDMTLSYHSEWPQVTAVTMSGLISDMGVDVSASRGKLYNGDIHETKLRIRNFAKPILELSGRVTSSLHDGAKFLVNSPITPKAKDIVAKTRFVGNIVTTLNLRLPLSDNVAKRSPLRFAGSVALNDNQVYMSKGKIDFTDISGKVEFDEDSLSSNDFTALILGSKGKFHLRSGKVEKKLVLYVDAKGVNSGAGLYKRFPLPGVQRIKGDIAWQGTLTFGHRFKGEEIPTQLQLQTDLAGVAIELPEPFRKTAEANRNLLYTIRFQEDDRMEMIAEYGNRVSAWLEIDNSFEPSRIKRGEVQFAAGKAKLPAAEELLVTGVLNDLAADQWRAVVDEHAALQKNEDDEPVLYIPVVLDMGYLSIPFTDDKDKQEKSTKKTIRPQLLPAFRGRITRFVMNGIDLGQLDFTSRKEVDGLFFDNIQLSSAALKFQGNSYWKYRLGRHQTTFKANLTTPDFGAMLKGAGYKAIVEKGNGSANFDLYWSGPPFDMEFDQLNGTVDMQIKDGSLTKVDPGAGKLLGLLSLSTLPRRLLLDFSDMSKGMSFDKIQGGFKIRNGNAITENMKIDGPLAEVFIVGRTGLHTQDFDQIMTVIPKASNTMPLVGVVVGGTQVGTVVLLLERLFGADMDKSLSSQYRISGSWKDPVIERIDKTKPPADEKAGKKALDEAA